MWWLFGRKSGTKPGKIITGLCPYCHEETPCQEIIKISETSVWFVPVAGGESVSGYVCLKCGNTFESFALRPEERKNLSGCFTVIILTIIVMAITIISFGFNWWTGLGIPIIAFFVWVMTLGAQEGVKVPPQKAKSQTHEPKKSSSFDIQVDRNMEGIKLEKEGNIDKAIELYEENIAEGFDGSHPYNRLVIIYRKRKLIDDEIRVLEKAVSLYENQYKSGINCSPDLQRFKKRLEKAKKLNSG